MARRGPRCTPFSFNPRSPQQRGATRPARRLYPAGQVSTHAPLSREERPEEVVLPGGEGCFNPRSPQQRGATVTPVQASFTPEASFNPRSPQQRGATMEQVAHADAPARFQPTLPSAERSDSRPSPSGTMGERFQPTLPSAERSDWTRGGCDGGRGGVSTHAPLSREERPSSRRWARPPGCFNPRSPQQRGATRTPPGHCLQGGTFQPTLPSAERSDAMRRLPQALQDVSTHAPLSREERPRPARKTSTSRLFQPTLPSAERSDCPPRHRGLAPGRFNPRSPQQRGATSRRVCRSRRCRSFNPRSPQQRGATQQPGVVLVPKQVSTHAPLSREERRPLLGGLALEKEFQPTLPSAERSDAPLPRAVSPWTGFNPRSPQQRGATTRFARQLGDLVGFQPTLPSAERSDQSDDSWPDRHDVSTHAPLSREERPQAPLTRRLPFLFQPTLPSAERSDLGR